MSSKMFNRASAIENGWRQCSIFTSTSCPILYSLLPEQHKDESYFYMVLSHPCSLLNPNLDSEPNLEYIVCEKLEKIDGNATYGKNPRLLHLQLSELNEFPVKLQQKNRGFIDKWSISEERPLISEVESQNESLITRWMANRYITTALPDKFESRVSIQKSKLTKAFANKVGAKCKALYISLNEFILDLEDNENYECTLVFILNAESYTEYVSEEDNDKTEYNDFLIRITEIFGLINGIELQRAFFISSNAFTINQAESGKLKKWQFDYISMAKNGELTLPV